MKNKKYATHLNVANGAIRWKLWRADYRAYYTRVEGPWLIDRDGRTQWSKASRSKAP